MRRPSGSLPELPSVVWTVLGGTLLTRTAFFMVWPFLAVILGRDYRLSPSQIGSILGSAFFGSAIAGFYAGNLSDRFGSRVIMIAGSSMAVAAYAALAVATSVWAYGAGAFLVGLSRAVLEAPGKALIADHVPDIRARELAFHLRYFLINLGGAVGPLLGLVFGLSARQPTFWIAATTYAVFAVLIAGALRADPAPNAVARRQHAGLRRAIDVMRRDRTFLLLVAAMFLSMSAYAQQESTLIQYISGASPLLGVRIVTALLVTNGLTIIVFQFPLLRLLATTGLYARIYLGLTLFGAAFVAYAFLPVAHLWPWVIATWVLSVGEAILFPTIQLQVDRLSPEGLKGSYFGAAGLSGLGFGFGPLVGGFLLERVGGGHTFLITAASTAACAGCYRAASRRTESVGPAIEVMP